MIEWVRVHFVVIINQNYEEATHQSYFHLVKLLGSSTADTITW